MNKKIVVIALLALQLGHQVYAGSGVSSGAFNAYLQLVQPSPATWAAATNASKTSAPFGEAGPDTTMSALQAGYTTTPPDFNTAWYAIMTATSFAGLTALVSPNQPLTSFFAQTLTVGATADINGPTIQFFGSAGDSTVCALYNQQAKLISPVYLVPATAATYSNTLPLPVTVAPGQTSRTLGYSAYPIFPSAVFPPNGGIYYMMCAAYRVSANVPTALVVTPADFNITWPNT